MLATEEYEFRNNRIISPGKFEGEMRYTPYFYGMMLEGWADEGIEGEFAFDVTPEDIEKFSELQGRERLSFTEDEQGFVHEL